MCSLKLHERQFGKSEGKFPYNENAVEGFTAFIATLVRQRSGFASEINYGCEDGRIGLLGIHVDVELSDAEHDELAERIARSRADQGVIERVVVRIDSA